MEIAQELELCLKNAILEGKLKDAIETLEQIVEYYGTVEFEVKQRERNYDRDMQRGSYNQNRGGIDLRQSGVYAERIQERSDSNRVGMDRDSYSGQYRNIPYQYRTQNISHIYPPTTYSQPANQLAQPNPIYIKPTPIYNQPNPQYTQPNPQYVQSNPQYAQPIHKKTQPIPQYAQPNPQFTQPIHQNTQPIPQYTQPNLQFAQPYPQYAQANPQYAHANPLYAQPIHQFAQPIPQVSTFHLPPSSQPSGKIHSIKLFSNLKK